MHAIFDRIHSDFVSPQIPKLMTFAKTTMRKKVVHCELYLGLTMTRLMHLSEKFVSKVKTNPEPCGC